MRRLFPAQLKFWRSRRGLSQLVLSLEAGVSPRHLSFLESGRARPSEEMVLRLLHVLAVPLREQNEVLIAAGCAPRFPEPEAEALSPEIERTLDLMLAQHEPYPLVALTLDARIVRSNRAAEKLFTHFLAKPEKRPHDMYALMLDPAFMRPFIVDWESFARGLISRLHRDALQRDDPRLTAAFERVFTYPGVSREWSQPDFSKALPATSTLRLSRGRLDVSFLIAVTTFAAPSQVTLEELRLESCFPLDDQTRRTCKRLAR